MDLPGASTMEAVEVRRSARRRRTVSAYRENGSIVVLVPAGMSRAEEGHWVTTMVERVTAAERRRRPTDERLQARAAELSRRHLEGRATPSSVRFVGNQRTRWGSCTPSTRAIRLSTRLQTMPAYVLDYVLLHELTHLLVPGHGPQFWRWLDSFPATERARGFLEGVSAAAGLDLAEDDVDGAETADGADPPG